VQGNDALDLVDEAWLKRGTPELNDPNAFVVDLGRPIGIDGETKVRIIVDTTTHDVITAYPQ